MESIKEHSVICFIS